MRTHIRLLSALVVSGVTLLLASAPSRSAAPASKDDVNKVRSYLDRIVAVVKDDQGAVDKDVDLLNRMNKNVNEVLKNTNPNDAESAQDAISVMSDYADAIRQTEDTARELGKAVKTADGVFTEDKAAEAKGILPEGTLTQVDQATVQDAKRSFDQADQAVKQEREAFGEDSKDLAANDNINVGPILDAGAVAPTWLVIQGWHPPPREVQSSGSGFVIIRNYDDGSRSGKLNIRIENGADAEVLPSSAIPVNDVPAGGLKKVDFTIRVNTPGAEVVYSVGISK